MHKEPRFTLDLFIDLWNVDMSIKEQILPTFPNRWVDQGEQKNPRVKSQVLHSAYSRHMAYG